MTLFGIDLLIDSTTGNYKLAEINGIRSGMNGFTDIYGDTRVKIEVKSMLSKKYGDIYVDQGKEFFENYIKKHPVKYQYSKLCDKFNFFKILDLIYVMITNKNKKIIFKGDFSWNKQIENSTDLDYDNFQNDIFSYLGNQEHLNDFHTVANVFNQEPIENRTINSFVAESISHNKLLQFNLLKESNIKKYLIDTCPINYNLASDKQIIDFISKQYLYVKKPILGATGIGVKIVSKENINDALQNESKDIKKLKRYKSDLKTILSLEKSLNPKINETLTNNIKDSENKIKKNNIKKVHYIQKAIKRKDYFFERGLHILQPFVNTRQESNQNSSIRAIVCNGHFVDAYKRTDVKEVVNMSISAKAESFSYDSNFKKMCEQIVNTYINETNKLSNNNFKEKLYSRYFV